MQNKKAKNKRNSRQKGFSLIEVLIAIAILAAITIPLAMNMISTSQINSKSKSTSTAADLSASVLESMQSVNLSDLLVEMNGYETNEYGEKLAYSIAKNSLHGFTVGDKFEARVSEDGKKSYVPVTKQADGMADSLVTSSIKVRKTNDDVVKTYFTGHKGEDGKVDNSYSVVMQDVHNDEDSFDIVMDIEEGQSYDMANINAMDQSDIVTMFESSKDSEEIIRTILSENKAAHSVSNQIPVIGDINGDGTVTEADVKRLQEHVNGINPMNFTDLQMQAFDINGDGEIKIDDATCIQRYLDGIASPFGKIYRKEYTITIQQDKTTEATNIIVECEYYVTKPGLLGEDKKVIDKRIGLFSTNSTFEFAKGIYLYYIPNTGDNFIINNRNELSTTVYLIASSMSDSGISGTYKPSITINELSSQVYSDSARTTVCSNIPDDPDPNKSQWASKNVVPPKDLLIKSLANVEGQQTLYNVSVKIYKHNKSSFKNNNVFEPNEKNLLIQTDGSFLDNSVMHDIDSNKTTGVNIDETLAVVVPGKVTYNGESQSGYTATNVTLSGDIEKIDAGRYTVFATPNTGYAWADGTNKQKAFDWEITPLKEAHAEIPSSTSKITKFEYDGTVHSPVVGEHVMINGLTQGKNVGEYRTIVTPEKNYAWVDAVEGAESEVRYIDWEITPKPVTVNWGAEYEPDTHKLIVTEAGEPVKWRYDGLTHIAQCEVKASDLTEGDSCGVILNNHMITNVGTQTANIVSLTNKNYMLANEAEKEKELKILSEGTVSLQSATTFAYDGEEKRLSFTNNKGVSVKSGTISATNAGEYQVVVGLEKGYKWEDGSDEDRTFIWRINPLKVKVKWGEPNWYNKTRDENGWATVETSKSGSETKCHFITNNGVDEIDEIKWVYDNQEHKVEKLYFVGENGATINSLTMDSVEIENNSITNVGDTIVLINNIKNNNYRCSASLKISVSPKIANFNSLKNLTYSGIKQNCAESFNDVELVPIKLSNGKSYPITFNDGIPEGYAPYEDIEDGYGIEDVIYQMDAGKYTIKLEPMENYTWEGGSTAPKEFTWTIKEAGDAWVSGMSKNKNGTLDIEEITYLYSGREVQCAYGENIVLSNPNFSIGALRSQTIEESVKDAPDNEEPIIEKIETAWVSLMEKGLYTVDVTPAKNHAWINGTTDTKTVTFKIGYPTYKARFNMSPIAWIDSDYRFYNGESISPYFTNLVGCYSFDVLEVPADPNSTVVGFKNENTHIILDGDKSKTNVGKYTLKYRNEENTNETADSNYNWEIAQRPIKIESTPEISESILEITSMDDIKSLIKNNLKVKASSKLIEEALSFGLATQNGDPHSKQRIQYYVCTWDDNETEAEGNWIEINGTTVSALKSNLKFVKKVFEFKLDENNNPIEEALTDENLISTIESDVFKFTDKATYVVTSEDNKLSVAVENPSADTHIHTLKEKTEKDGNGVSVKYYECTDEQCQAKFDSPDEAKTITFLAESDITAIYDDNHKPLYQVMGYGDKITDISMTLYKDGTRITKLSGPGEYVFKVNSIKIMHGSTTDVSNCYEVDLKNATGTIELTSAGQQSVEDGSIVAFDIISPDYILIGDANRDGDINGIDLDTIDKYIANETLTIDQIAADINFDNIVDAKDREILRKYIENFFDLGDDCRIGYAILVH